MRRVLTASLFLNVLLVAALGLLWSRRGEPARREMPLGSSGWLHQPAREAFRRMPSEPGCSVFVGDSLTAEGPWGELFGDLLNRGVKGDTVDGVAGRLDEVLARAPGRVFLQIGINDLHGGRSPRYVIDGIEALVSALATEGDGTRLYVLSLLPVRSGAVFDASAAAGVNAGVRAVNAEIPAVALRHGAVFVDLRSELCDPDGALRADATYDGVHLTPEGYVAWAAAIRAHLD